MNDPYLDDENTFDRLRREYIKHGKLIVATDYDSTLAPWPPGENSTHEKVLDLLKKCVEVGFYVVVFTASAPDRYSLIQNFCDENNLKISSINKNPIKLPFGNHGKIYFNILLDDRAGLSAAYNILNRLVEEIENT